MSFTVTDLMISALPENGSVDARRDRADTADISTCEESTTGQCGDVPQEVPADSTCEESTTGQCGAPEAPDDASTCEESTTGQCTHLPTCMKSKAIGESERAMLHRDLAAALAARH